MGLMPEPVAKRRQVGWAAAGARSMRKPCPITGDTLTSLPATTHGTLTLMKGGSAWTVHAKYAQRAIFWSVSHFALCHHMDTHSLSCICEGNAGWGRHYCSR